MKKTLVFGLLLLTGAAMAQTSAAPDWEGKNYKFWQNYPGYVVTTKGDTIKGYLQHQDRDGNQEKAIFFSDPNDKKTKKVYKPNDLKAYMVGDKIYRSVDYSGGLVGGHQSFALVIMDGQLHQYRWYSNNTSTGGLSPVKVMRPGESDYDYDKRVNDEKDLWQNGDGKIQEHQGLILGFNKKFSELVADDKELAEKVKNKDKGYGLMQIYDIAAEYNKWYAENHK